MPIWDRQTDEDLKAFAAFTYYRDLGARRRIDDAYRKANPATKAERASSDWYRFSSQFNWSDRARKYDEFLRQQKAEAVQEYERQNGHALGKEREAHKKMEAALCAKAFKRVSEILDMPLVTKERKKTKADGKVTLIIKERVIPPPMLFAAVAMLQAGSRIGRQALGIADDDGKEMTIDEFRSVFFQSRQIMINQIPAGALPSVPENPDAKPVLRLTYAGDNSTANGNGYETVKPPRERPL